MALIPHRGRTRRCYGHLLVLLTFHGPRPPGHVAAWKDGKRTNNRASNLSWAPRPRGAEAWGGPAGSGHQRCALTPDQVRYARAQVAAGESTQEELAQELGVSKWTVGRAIRGETYRDVEWCAGFARPAGE